MPSVAGRRRSVEGDAAAASLRFSATREIGDSQAASELLDLILNKVTLFSINIFYTVKKV